MRFAKRSIQLLNVTLAATTTYDISNLVKDFLCFPSIWLEATENSGTATCDVKVVGTQDGTNYLDLVTMTQLSASGREVKALLFLAKTMKITVTIGGTGNWTVKVYGISPMANAQGVLMP